MKKIKLLIEFFKDLDSKLEDLVSLNEPSNYKTLLDISSKLYDDEVSHYRYLEDKSGRFLTFITFLLPSTLTILYWLYSNNSSLFNPYVVLAISLTFVAIITSLVFVFASYSLLPKPVLIISEQNMKEADSENFNSFYLSFIKAYNQSVDKHRAINKKKADRLDYSYKFLCAYVVLTFITGIFIAISFIFNI